MDDADDRTTTPERGRGQRLLHRWLVEYNPMYLVSAALVLAGVVQLSSAMPSSAGAAIQLGITAVTELYAWALIGGAALLVRIQLRRPAVMVGLLAALYQTDPTLHTETCAFLGLAGAVGSVLWLASFVAKLGALAWALQLRLSRSAWTLPTIGAVALAAMPWLLRRVDGDTAATLIATCVFGLLAAGLWTHRRIESRVVLGPWAQTVKSRTLPACWAGLAVMMVVHAGFWFAQHAERPSAAPLVPVAMLLVTRLMRREAWLWSAVGGTLAYVAGAQPHQLAPIAAMAAIVLLLHAWRRPSTTVPDATVAPPQDPYRTVAAPVRPPMPLPTLVRAEPRVVLRLRTGAIACGYLAVWALGWVRAPWPEHVLWLDVLLLAGTAVAAWRWRARAPLLLPGATCLHLVVARELVPTPSSPLQWGLACVASGFALLLLALLASIRWRPRRLHERS